MSRSKKAAKSATIIIMLGLAGKGLGFIREMLIGAKFGSGMKTDTYLIALSSIALFTGLITKSINTTMIPVLSEIEKKEGKEGKILHTNNLLNIVSLISIIIIILAFILAPTIVKIMAPGFETKGQFNLAVLLMRIGLPSILFSGIQGVLRGFLQTEGSFTETAASSFPMNFIYISFLVFLSGIFGIKGLMVASVLASISQVALQIYGIRKLDYKYSFLIDFKDEYVKRILYLIPPILISVGISDLNSIVDKAMASTLVKGSISALNYAQKLNGLVTGVFISALTTVMYPILSKEANKDSYDGLKKVTINGINIILLITIPATIGMIILSTPIVKLAYQRGKFDSTATFMTAGALVFTSIRMATTSIRTLVNNAYYSMQDTKTPVFIGFLAVGVNIIFNFILIRPMAHKGLALATTISSIVACIILLYVLRKKIGSFGFLSSIKCGGKSLLASSVMGVVVYFLYNFLGQTLGAGILMEIIALGLTIGVGGLFYFILIYLFKIEEVNWAIGLVKERLKK